MSRRSKKRGGENSLKLPADAEAEEAQVLAAAAPFAADIKRWGYVRQIGDTDVSGWQRGVSFTDPDGPPDEEG